MVYLSRLLFVASLAMCADGFINEKTCHFEILDGGKEDVMLGEKINHGLNRLGALFRFKRILPFI